MPMVVGDLGTIGRLRSHLDNSDLFWPNVSERIVTYLQREVVCASADLLAKHLHNIKNLYRLQQLGLLKI